MDDDGSIYPIPENIQAFLHKLRSQILLYYIVLVMKLSFKQKN